MTLEEELEQALAEILGDENNDDNERVQVVNSESLKVSSGSGERE